MCGHNRTISSSESPSKRCTNLPGKILLMLSYGESSLSPQRRISFNRMRVVPNPKWYFSNRAFSVHHRMHMPLSNLKTHAVFAAYSLHPHNRWSEENMMAYIYSPPSRSLDGMQEKYMCWHRSRSQLLGVPPDEVLCRRRERSAALDRTVRDLDARMAPSLCILSGRSALWVGRSEMAHGLLPPHCDQDLALGREMLECSGSASHCDNKLNVFRGRLEMATV
jgi:hypothetical protein